MFRWDTTRSPSTVFSSAFHLSVSLSDCMFCFRCLAVRLLACNFACLSFFGRSWLVPVFDLWDWRFSGMFWVGLYASCVLCVLVMCSVFLWALRLLAALCVPFFFLFWFCTGFELHTSSSSSASSLVTFTLSFSGGDCVVFAGVVLFLSLSGVGILFGYCGGSCSGVFTVLVTVSSGTVFCWISSSTLGWLYGSDPPGLSTSSSSNISSTVTVILSFSWASLRTYFIIPESFRGGHQKLKIA